MALTIGVEVEAAPAPSLAVTAASVAGVCDFWSLSLAPEAAGVAAGAAVVACGAAAAAVLGLSGAGRLRGTPAELHMFCAKESVAEDRGQYSCFGVGEGGFTLVLFGAAFYHHLAL